MDGVYLYRYRVSYKLSNSSFFVNEWCHFDVTQRMGSLFIQRIEGIHSHCLEYELATRTDPKEGSAIYSLCGFKIQH